MGRPSKRTPENRDRILSILRAATTTRKSAYTAVGISRDAFADWLKADAAFAEAVDQAEQEAITRNVLLVQKAASPRTVKKTRTEYAPPPKDEQGRPIPGAVSVIVSQTVEEWAEEGDWRAAKWLLETRDPESFGKQVSLTKDGDTIKGYGAGVDFDDL